MDACTWSLPLLKPLLIVPFKAVSSQLKRLGKDFFRRDLGDALFPSMPESALVSTHIDFVLPLVNMAAFLVRLVSS